MTPELSLKEEEEQNAGEQQVLARKGHLGSARGKVGDSEITYNNQPLISVFNCVLLSATPPSFCSF